MRLLCTDVWPALFSALAYRSDDPVRVWRLTKEQAITDLGAAEPRLGDEGRRFYDLVHAYYTAETTVDVALRVLRQGLRFLTLVTEWYAAQEAQS